MMPVVPFSMLFDYSLVQDFAKEHSLKRDTFDSVAKFKEGYERILNHLAGTQKLEPIFFRIYMDMWRTYILKNLLYPEDTLFIDFPNPDESIDPDLLYMFAGLVKPGKHRAILYDPISDVWYKRDFYVDERQEDKNVPSFADYNNMIAEAGPVINSILKDWKVDTAATIRNCMEHDAANWKMANSQFIKDPTEYENLRMMIENNFGILKDLFLHTAARYSEFPLISNYGTEELAKNIGIMDGKVVLKDTINRSFIAANTSDRDADDRTGTANAMARFAFIEFIVRLARAKYKDPGVVKTTPSALRRFLDEYLIPYHSTYCQDWQPFRDNFICRTVIDNLMHANKRSLEQIFIKHVSQVKAKIFTL